jgi:polar amino acid transport system substrate-binding protein
MKIGLILLNTLLVVQLSLFASEKIEIYTEHYPPYNFQQNKKLTGLSVEILDAMLKQMNSKQSIEDVKLTNWSRAYKVALKKKDAMVFSTTRTEQRENLFKWIGPIATTTVGIIAPKRKKIKIKEISDLNKYKIGAVKEDVGEQLLLANGVNKNNIQNVKGNDAINISFGKMEKDRIDMFSYNVTVAFSNARLEGFDTSKYEIVHILKKSQLYFAFNKNTDDKNIKKFCNPL